MCRSSYETYYRRQSICHQCCGWSAVLVYLSGNGRKKRLWVQRLILQINTESSETKWRQPVCYYGRELNSGIELFSRQRLEINWNYLNYFFDVVTCHRNTSFAYGHALLFSSIEDLCRLVLEELSRYSLPFKWNDLQDALSEGQNGEDHL